MSIIDTVTLWLKDAGITHFSGKSLAFSLYTFPVDILLRGDIGTGKTTFLQGFSSGLGIREHVTSPTFALEQRYPTILNKVFIHIDLYRLKPEQTHHLLHASDTHDGIRCIEWADRLPFSPGGPAIFVDLAEEKDGRRLTIRFDDIPLPSTEQIAHWQEEVRLPSNVVAHSRKVTDVALSCADRLLAGGCIVRRAALERAALAHDLLRFIDFREGTTPAGTTYSRQEEAVWKSVRDRFPGKHHEEACAAFLGERGYRELGSIILWHGAAMYDPSSATIEQTLLYYADKRVALDRIVPVEERFREFVERYGPQSEDFSRKWRDQALMIEHSLFPDGPPV